MTAPMKLSDAILKGCKIVPHQAFGALFRDARGEECNMSVAHSACALGAAEIATNTGGWAWFNYAVLTQCPVCGKSPTYIAHLNDDHRWSRDRFAEDE